MPQHRILTGYRPTGKLHLGHWFGNLQNMLRLQHEYDAFYFVADWHALTSEWQDPSRIYAFGREMVADWLAAGLDPERCTIYRQSDLPEVIELMLYFNMVLPMPWLERTPSYKEQQANITNKDLSNVGFFLYPALMAADIAIVKSDLVPVGEDQEPHLELTREIVRRFNGTYGAGTLLEPQALLAKEGARVPGLDGRKMSKSYGNAIFITDPPEEMRRKAMACMTDPARKRKDDPGDPELCPLHQIHKLIASPDDIATWEACCPQASCGCVAHKQQFAEDLVSYFADFQARRAEIDAHPERVDEVLETGKERVAPIARATIADCRAALALDGPVRGK
ncbi:MAG: tryptophan--tRNA ligase [Actinomycetia bacterium]|nr:tryptophan--tRNA ligase [Actinomycetes bacterium]